MSRPSAVGGRPTARRLAAVAGGLLLLGIGWWAGRATLTPPDASGESAAPALYVVKQGQVGRLMSFSATATWQRHLVGHSGAGGTVTAVWVREGAETSAGARLYSVDERPVVLAEGRVPAFRDLSSGAEGRDVRQVQTFLHQAGLYSGVSDGRFDADVSAAVRAWQRELGILADGMVRRGDLAFVPDLPRRIQLSEQIAVGQQVSAGAESIYGLNEAPQFTVRLGSDQADLVPLDAEVIVRAGDTRWRGQIVDATSLADAELELMLGREDGRPLCRHQCDAVATRGHTTFPVDFVAVPTTNGPVVPAAALQSDADGTPFVTTSDGARVIVRVIAGDAGWSVVEGVEVGTSLRLFGDSGQASGAGSG